VLADSVAKAVIVREGGRSSIPCNLSLAMIFTEYWIPAFAGMTENAGAAEKSMRPQCWNIDHPNWD
jgi:hypothetical protein